jgi:uncharacterized protein
MSAPTPVQNAAAAHPYDCAKCPGYCCSYPLIELQLADIERLAAHLKMPLEQAKVEIAEEAWGVPYAMKRKPDQHYGKICRFFDTDKRACTVYDARPEKCREYPKQARCGYWDFLTFERIQQEDPTAVALTDHA